MRDHRDGRLAPQNIGKQATISMDHVTKDGTQAKYDRSKMHRCAGITYV
ncbi:hypothetical protein [Dyella flagellata]|nr:hypothetical protein [Dyella flagellata]